MEKTKIVRTGTTGLVWAYFTRRKPGRVIATGELTHLGPRAAIDQALSRLVRAGDLKRVGRGIYVRPYIVEGFGEVPPPLSSIRNLIARRRGAQLQVARGAAANALGLITQVPGREIFYSMSRLTHATLKRYHIEVRHTSSKALMVGAGTVVGTVLQALRFMGPEHVDESVHQKIRCGLSDKQLRALGRSIEDAPRWMRPHLRAITALHRES